jgi:homoserine kinase
MPLQFTADGPVTVRTPATSANLGPGFDSFGLALGLYDEVTARVSDGGLSVTVDGEGAGTVAVDESHLVVTAMRATFDALGGQPPGLEICCLNRIPHGRGLGSSAAAIVSGILLARGLTEAGDQLLDIDAVLQLANELEGHPDNVAACLLGGFTLAWSELARCGAVRLEVTGVRPIVFIPGGHSSTATARAALPTVVPHRDAAFNVSRAALLVVALTQRPDLLLTATQDRLHQDYRAASMAESAGLVTSLRAANVASVISGAGSAVLALCGSDEEKAAAQAVAPPGWRTQELDIADGARVSRAARE